MTGDDPYSAKALSHLIMVQQLALHRFLELLLARMDKSQLESFVEVLYIHQGNLPQPSDFSTEDEAAMARVGNAEWAKYIALAERALAEHTSPE